MNIFTIAIISIALSVAAQFSLKAGMASAEVTQSLAQPLNLSTAFTVFTNKFVFAGFSLYALGAVVWLGVLSRWEVSKAYPLVGLGFVFTVAIGVIVGEHVTPLRVIGVALICMGVFLVGRS